MSNERQTEKARVLTLELEQQLLEVEVLDAMTDKLIDWGIQMR